MKSMILLFVLFAVLLSGCSQQGGSESSEETVSEEQKAAEAEKEAIEKQNAANEFYATTVENAVAEYGVFEGEWLPSESVGVISAQLVDFDGDGFEELMMIYAYEDPESVYSVSIIFEVWQGEELILSFEFYEKCKELSEVVSTGTSSYECTLLKVGDQNVLKFQGIATATNDEVIEWSYEQYNEYITIVEGEFVTESAMVRTEKIGGDPILDAAYEAGDETYKAGAENNPYVYYVNGVEVDEVEFQAFIDKYATEDEVFIAEGPSLDISVRFPVPENNAEVINGFIEDLKIPE